MFNLISKIKVWYVSRRYPNLRNQFKSSLFLDCYPKLDDNNIYNFFIPYRLVMNDLENYENGGNYDKRNY